jgi:hypothetical protein
VTTPSYPLEIEFHRLTWQNFITAMAVYGILFAWQEKEADVPGYHPRRLGWMVGTTEIHLIVTTSESRGIELTVKESPLLARNTVD